MCIWSVSHSQDKISDPSNPEDIKAWKGKTVIYFAPHPDDDIASSGTLATLTKNGNTVYIVVYCNGNAGSHDYEMTRDKLAQIRKQEDIAANQIVGIPKENILGQPGDGFAICMWMLNNTRLSCAAGALGVDGACVDLAIRYANERRQFGQPVSKFQLVQGQLAEMVAEHQAAQLLVYNAAHLKDKGLPNQIQTSVAKYFVSEAAVRAANEAMKVFGSYGFSTEYPIARFYRDVKSFQMVEGTSNIQKLIIASIACGHQPNR